MRGPPSLRSRGYGTFFSRLRAALWPVHAHWGPQSTLIVVCYTVRNTGFVNLTIVNHSAQMTVDRDFIRPTRHTRPPPGSSPRMSGDGDPTSSCVPWRCVKRASVSVSVPNRTVQRSPLSVCSPYWDGRPQLGGESVRAFGNGNCAQVPPRKVGSASKVQNRSSRSRSDRLVVGEIMSTFSTKRGGINPRMVRQTP